MFRGLASLTLKNYLGNPQNFGAEFGPFGEASPCIHTLRHIPNIAADDSLWSSCDTRIKSAIIYGKVSLAKMVVTQMRCERFV